ncbi:hypothetical protein [Saliphagus infecundisoli]|uniref:Uncharacterized protein n=1 Tax=Saliphagus infecundisoli TaxID=1849069 RepID=A0ABD5QNH2_9EURY|nr:hypothetical protein [Saliphagus infecundisoli]
MTGHQTPSVAQLLQHLITTVDALNQRVDEQDNRISDLEEENQQLRERDAEQDERINDLEEATDEQSEEIHLLRREAQELRKELATYREENEKDKASIRQRVNEIEEDQSNSDSDSAHNEDLTPIERISLLGAEDTGLHVTQSVERAVTIYENFDQWAHRTPKGLVLKDGLRTLLQTARDETLAWKQVNRAANALEELSKGAIEFKKHRRHGNILVKEDDPTGCQSSSALG